MLTKQTGHTSPWLHPGQWGLNERSDRAALPGLGCARRRGWAQPRPPGLRAAPVGGKGVVENLGLGPHQGALTTKCARLAGLRQSCGSLNYLHLPPSSPQDAPSPYLGCKFRRPPGLGGASSPRQAVLLGGLGVSPKNLRLVMAPASCTAKTMQVTNLPPETVFLLSTFPCPPVGPDLALRPPPAAPPLPCGGHPACQWASALPDQNLSPLVSLFWATLEAALPSLSPHSALAGLPPEGSALVRSCPKVPMS